MAKRKKPKRQRTISVVPKTPLHPERVRESAGGDPKVMVEMLLEWADAAAGHFNVSSKLPAEIEKARKLIAAAERAGDKHLRSYASSLCCNLCCLRKALAENPPDPERIARLAMDVGISIERVRVHIEAPYITGRRKTNQRLDAYNPKRLPFELKQQALARFNELHAAEPGRKLSSIERQIQRELGIPARTLQSWRASR